MTSAYISSSPTYIIYNSILVNINLFSYSRIGNVLILFLVYTITTVREEESDALP